MLQDSATAALIGGRSYNELLARLTTAEAPPALPPPSAAAPQRANGSAAGTSSARDALGRGDAGVDKV